MPALYKLSIYLLFVAIGICHGVALFAQTDTDGLMMDKNYLCTGLVASASGWKNYWEGENLRDNQNLGTVTTKSLAAMANYGLTNKFNLIAWVPYVSSRASAGQLAGQSGFQDVSVYAKYRAASLSAGAGKLKMYGIAGFSLPVSNYTPDLMPLSIGNQSKTGIFRALADYELNKFSVSMSGSYHYRGNVTLDRNTYYTTTIHYTSEVKMPNAAYYQLRAGYRSKILVAEAFADQWKTLGGFDITKNNMPFVSNRMDATRLGLHVKYTLQNIKGLQLVADAASTIAGRNVGKGSMVAAGIFYFFKIGNQ